MLDDDNTYHRFPDESASETYVKGFQHRHFNKYSAYRNRHLQRITTALYYIIGQQWIEPDRDTMLDGVRGFVFRDQRPDDEVELPRPVTNIIAPAVDVEFATLSKRQWIPKIPSYSRDPRLQAANKVAQDVLRDRLQKLHWEDLRDRFILNQVQMGTAIAYSYWDETYFETRWTAEPNPVQCAQCGTTYASKSVPRSFGAILSQGGTPTINDVPDGDEEEDLNACPNCGGQLAPTDLTEQQSHGLDPFQRPLGSMVPKGSTALELVTPYEYFPQNAGLGYTPETVRQHGIMKIRSLDWVEEHHPELIDQVSPEDPTELMRDHPLLGRWDIIGRHTAAYDSGIYDHHVRVFDLIAEPSYRFPKGRFIRVIGNTQKLIAKNEDLIRTVQSEGDESVDVPIAMVTSAVWKPREGEFWGKCLADDLISPQNRINGMDAQTIEARERMGSPNLLVPADANLDGPAFRATYGLGKIFYWEPSPLNPNAKPEPFGSILMPSGVYNERNACLQDATKIIGPADIEIGEAPRNITTTSGLQILGEQAERRRATRERGITSSFRRIWEHQLQMLWGLRVDVDSYEAELPDGSWEIKEFRGQMIAGQTKVQIEREAYIDHSIIIRESTREALMDGLYDVSTPTARKKLLELMDLPTDVNEDSNLQIEHARRQWVDFVDEGKIPVIDPTLDNPAIRAEVLGQFLSQDEGLQLAEAAGWPQILPLIAGWQDDFQRLSAMDAQARQLYGGEPDPTAAAETYAKLTIEYQNAKAAYEANPMKMGVPPPQEPIAPNFLPQQPEQRVWVIWQNLLNKRSQQPGRSALDGVVMQSALKELKDPAVKQQEIESYMRFRAVYEAYRLAAPAAPPPGSQSVAAPLPPRRGGPNNQGQPPSEGAQEPPAPQLPVAP